MAKIEMQKKIGEITRHMTITETTAGIRAAVMDEKLDRFGYPFKSFQSRAFNYTKRYPNLGSNITRAMNYFHMG